MICGTIIIVLAYILVKGTSSAIEYLPKNDPQEENINNLPFWIFRHGKIYSGKFYSEVSAINFARKHKDWLVGYFDKSINKSVHEINFESRSTVWDGFDMDNEKNS